MHKKNSRVDKSKFGFKTKLNNVLELEEKEIVGRFPSKNISYECLKDYTRLNFEPLVGYTPHIMTLTNGWLVWDFKTT